MKQIKKRQRGFTMVELTMVIGITGVLAATVVQKVSTVNGDARQAAINSVAGVLESAGSSNHATHGANSDNGIEVLNCSTTTDLLQIRLDGTKLAADGITSVPAADDFVASYTITAQAVAADATVNCVLSTVSTPTLTASYLGYGIGGED